MPSSIRGGVEAITLAAGIVFLILMIPRARTLYETRIHNQLEALNLTEFLKPSKTPNASPTTTQSEVDEGSGDVSSEYGDDSDAEDDAPGAKRGEIWRINVRVANVRDAQTKTQEILAKSGASRVESGALGIEAPGGIQFDLQIKLDEVSTVRTALRSLALPEPEEVDSGITEDLTEARRQLPPRKSFTWYKSRSKEPLPEGKVRLVIWLSQM
jgi:hypothetical protein